jgi:UDP-glucose 4-epimerase
VNWLVTGGCGFIGVNLVKRLLAEGNHSIRIIDNLSVGTREDLAAISSFTESSASEVSSTLFPSAHAPTLPALVVGDILDEQLALEVARGVDVIVHLAANAGVGSSVQGPRSDCLVNVIGTLNYLEAARVNEVRRFVFASSCAAVGERQPPIDEEAVPHPVSPYGASKLSGEGYCSAYYGTFGIQTVVLRFANAYGPFSGHKNSVVAGFIRQAVAAQPFQVHGDGEQTRDFIHVDDLIEAIRLAACQPHAGGEIFQIATGRETSVLALLELLFLELAEAGHSRREAVHSAPRPAELRRVFADISKAKRMLGWEPRIELTEGLRRTLQWFLANPISREPLAELSYSVTPAKAGVQKSLGELDSGLRRNDVQGLLQEAPEIQRCCRSQIGE